MDRRLEARIGLEEELDRREVAKKEPRSRKQVLAAEDLAMVAGTRNTECLCNSSILILSSENTGTVAGTFFISHLTY